MAQQEELQEPPDATKVPLPVTDDGESARNKHEERHVEQVYHVEQDSTVGVLMQVKLQEVPQHHQEDKIQLQRIPIGIPYVRHDYYC